jgi:flagellar biosynthesis/type III secretory pathway M-ring protein FliF/YscJ
MEIDTAKNILLIVKGISYAAVAVTFYFFVVLPLIKTIKTLENHVDNSGSISQELTPFSEIINQPGGVTQMPAQQNIQSNLDNNSGAPAPDSASSQPDKTVKEWANLQPQQAAQLVKDWMAESKP